MNAHRRVETRLRWEGGLGHGGLARPPPASPPLSSPLADHIHSTRRLHALDEPIHLDHSLCTDQRWPHASPTSRRLITPSRVPSLPLDKQHSGAGAAMSERPALSISVSRRSSLRASISGSSTPALVSSPLTSHPPITPQNAHFWDSYFPAPGAGVVGLQTPPLNAQPSLYPPAGTFPGRKGLLRRNSSLSSVSSSVVEDDKDEQEWTHDEEEQVQRVRHLLATLQVNDGPRADLSLSLSLCADLRCLPRQARPHRGTLPCQRPPAVQLHQHGRARRAARSRRERTSRGSPRALHPGGPRTTRRTKSSRLRTRPTARSGPTA